MRRRNAFSLVELCLVMATMGVLAAVAVPRYQSSLCRYRLESAARRLASDLELAHARSRTLSTTQTLTVTGNTYQIAGMANPERPASTYTVDLAADPYYTTIAAAACGPTSGMYSRTYLTFNGYGAPYTTDTLGAVTPSQGRFVLRCGGIQKTVRVDVDSGAVTIQ